MSRSSAGAAALAGLAGLSLAPAFLAPTAPGQSALRGGGAAAGTTHPAAAVAATGTKSAVLCTGSVVTAAALSLAAAAARRTSARAQQDAVALKAFNPGAQVGVTAPLGFFDPLGFTKEVDEAGFKKLRSSEIKHGRAAMMGALGLLVQSAVKLPGYENVPSGLAAQWTEPGRSTLLVIFHLIGFLELGLNVWREDPEKPGSYGDPFNLGNDSVENQNKELNNGRMAMFAFLGIVSAEIYTGKSGIAQFAVAQSKASGPAPAFAGRTVTARSAAGRAEKSGLRAFDGASQPGASAPLGYFDPLGLAKTQERFDKFQVSEIKHGRICMLAILGSFVQHFARGPDLQSVPNGVGAFSDPFASKGVIGLSLLCGFLELGPWNDNNAKAPGNYGDPAGFSRDIGGYDKEFRTKEINNGRLAMMAVTGLLAQEAATGQQYADIAKDLGF